MSWPPNPYLDAWLRTPDGQAYLEKYGVLENWKRRHLMDPVIHQVDTVTVVEQPGWFLMNPDAAVTLTPAPEKDVWDF